MTDPDATVDGFCPQCDDFHPFEVVESTLEDCDAVECLHCGFRAEDHYYLPFDAADSDRMREDGDTDHWTFN